MTSSRTSREKSRQPCIPLTIGAAPDPAIIAVDPTTALAADFSETARILFAVGSASDTLRKVRSWR
jgi:hypothetical protein